MPVACVTSTRHSPETDDMVQRVFRALAIGVGLSIGCAAVLAWRWRRADSRAYEAWWEHRERVRANGNRPHPPLFV